MEDTLVDPLLALEPADLAELVRQLRREVLELRQEVAKLRRENAELRQQVGYWKAMHARAVHRAEQLEAEVEQLRGENRKLQDQLFGRKSEKSSTQDRSNHLEGEEDDRESSTPRKRGQRKDRPGPKRRNYSHLPVIEDPRELPEDQRVCPQCGAPSRRATPRIPNKSMSISGSIGGGIRRRRYQRTCTCENCPRTFTAPPVPKLIPKGLLGTSVWVEILIDKYYSHRPTERLLDQWRLLGLDLAGGTVNGGLERLEPLFRPVYEALLARNAQSIYAQADETHWMVFIDLAGKTGHRWWLWVFLGADTVVFRLDPSRSHEVPEGHFAGAVGVVLMVDRYSAYKAMVQVKLGNVVLVFCWSHVRRRFRQGWQSVPGAQRVGLGLAATDPRPVSVPTPALDRPRRRRRVCRRRYWGAANGSGHEGPS